jgi:hypothetical protein
MNNIEKFSYLQVRDELTKLIDATSDYLPSVLFLKGLVAELIADLPEDQQQIYIDRIRTQLEYITFN